MQEKLEALEEAKFRIESDKEVFEKCGRNTKGHFRAIMLIDELIKEYKEEIKS